MAYTKVVFWMKSNEHCIRVVWDTANCFIQVFQSSYYRRTHINVGLLGSQENRINRISAFEKWVWSLLMGKRMKSSLEALLENFQRIIIIENYKMVKKIFLCVICCLVQLFNICILSNTWLCILGIPSNSSIMKYIY